MAINLSPRDFDNIFREQEENENELARIELDQARQELQREKKRACSGEERHCKAAHRVGRKRIAGKRGETGTQAATAGTAAENGQFRADYVIRD